VELEAIGCRFHNPMHRKVKAHGPFVGDKDTAAGPRRPSMHVLQLQRLLFPFGHGGGPDVVSPKVLSRKQCYRSGRMKSLTLPPCEKGITIELSASRRRLFWHQYSPESDMRQARQLAACRSKCASKLQQPLASGVPISHMRCSPWFPKCSSLLMRR
jgi:hypothetical protein